MLDVRKKKRIPFSKNKQIKQRMVMRETFSKLFKIQGELKNDLRFICNTGHNGRI